ncbi:DUF4249 domain-containing protein [Dyadobacter sp. CY345]|uniref:DUF4249 domain-containing protein n=1 Tax=Dyadobacter sp. CY345 TaxID=2909335 RepID=UPI001F254F65|nr:DUF4249 domain-containing protein [Dyadobacter sp. CY345]MCF2446963.1 DUF4249 domain-containing protein [Dyadobacter sp. CY345]
MKLYKCLVLLFSLSLLWGCETLVNDLDEDKLPKIESKLAVECYISPQSEEIMVRVTASQPLFGSSTYESVNIKNAKVILSGPGAEIQIPYNDSTQTYMIAADKFKIEAGQQYSLLVDDGKRIVKSSCTVPANKVTIKNYSIDTIVGHSYREDTSARVKISWDDIKGETNYYSIRGYSLTNVTYPGYIPETGVSGPVRSNNKAFLNIDRNYLVNDVNLDGITFNAPVFYIQLPSKYSFSYVNEDGKLDTAYSDPVFKEVYFEVLNLDVNYYKFHKSVDASWNNDNPFVEPTLVYTNIEGGLGCFGAYNVGSISIKP